MKIRDELLKKINESPGVSVSELSKILIVTKGNISIHLKNLEKINLIKKYRDVENQRVLKIHPTKKGKDLYMNIKTQEILKKRYEK